MLGSYAVLLLELQCAILPESYKSLSEMGWRAEECDRWRAKLQEVIGHVPSEFNAHSVIAPTSTPDDTATTTTTNVTGGASSPRRMTSTMHVPTSLTRPVTPDVPAETRRVRATTAHHGARHFDTADLVHDEDAYPTAAEIHRRAIRSHAAALIEAELRPMRERATAALATRSRGNQEAQGKAAQACSTLA